MTKITLFKGEEARTHEVSDARLRDQVGVRNRAANAQDENALRLMERVKSFRAKLEKGTPHKHGFEMIEVGNDILFQIQEWYLNKDYDPRNPIRLPEDKRLKLERRLSKFEHLYDTSLVTDGVLSLPDRRAAFHMDAKLNLLHIPRIGFKHLPGEMVDKVRKSVGNALIKAGKKISGQKN